MTSARVVPINTSLHGTGANSRGPLSLVADSILPPDPLTQVGDSMRAMSQAELLEQYARGERNFENSTFEDLDLKDVCLAGANLAGADLGFWCELENVDFSKACLRGAKLEMAGVNRVDLSGADMRDACFAGAIFSFGSLAGADVTRANFRGAKFEGCVDSDFMCDGADFTEAEFIGSILPSGFLDRVIAIGMSLDGETFNTLGVDENDPRFGRTCSRDGELKLFVLSPDHRVKALVAGGESERVEFKSTLRWNVKAGRNDPKMGAAVLVAICGLLNANGGSLLVGVADDGTILGLESDNFPDDDQLQRHFGNLVRDRIGADILAQLKYTLVRINDKRVLWVRCPRASAPAYLHTDGGKTEFYVRTGPSTDQLDAKAAVDYMKIRFPDDGGRASVAAAPVAEGKRPKPRTMN